MAENVFMNAQAQYDLNNINDIIGSMGGEKDFADRSEISDIGMRGSVTEATSVFTNMESEIEIKKKPYVQIIEQPQPKALRFRYSCEGRSAGSIPGVSSTSENKTYPTIKIMNYKGSAVVVVSLVTIDKPYRPHPHKLVGKEGCKNGVCTVTIDNDAMEYVFSNLGIQCVKKKEVEEALQHREEIRVDPFSTGFQHRKHPQNLDLNAARLCFQVFLNNKKEGRFTIPLKPVVSDSIFDKKATCDLNICKLSDCSSCVSGGKEIILLCDKVAKEDVQVRFFEVRDGREVWEGFGDFQASDVHKQVAIAFKTPKYKDLQVMETVRVFIQLVRPSDRSASDPRPFDFLPMDADRFYNAAKRRKLIDSGEPSTHNDYLEKLFGSGGMRNADTIASTVPRVVKVPTRPSRLNDIKIEPPDYSMSPSPEGAVNLSPHHSPFVVKTSISPQHGTAGGIMYQTMPQMSPQMSPQMPIQNVYYQSPPPPPPPPPLPSVPHSLNPTPPPSVSLQSPPQYYASVAPGVSYANEDPASAAVYARPPDGFMTDNDAAMQLMEMQQQSLLFDPSRPNTIGAPAAAEVPLPDLGLMNSTDLNSLSASLSCSLTLNPLDKKGGDEDASKMSLNTPTPSTTFLANIPTSQSMADDVGCSSDSVRALKKELRKLNEL